MTLRSGDELARLRAIGRVVARTLEAMGRALEPGMTTRELDDIGRGLLENEGARSAPESTYGFPGATCISVFPDIAHGVPGDRALRPGDLVNIDVSAERDGFFADTGASFTVPPVSAKVKRLCRDGRQAMWAGINAVKVGGSLGAVGRAIQRFADRNGYTLIRNLASHGVGGALHEEPESIPTWFEPREARPIGEGLVFTIEPFLSLGGHWARAAGGDDWTLRTDLAHPTVQYEHTLVATSRGPIVVTLP